MKINNVNSRSKKSLSDNVIKRSFALNSVQLAEFSKKFPEWRFEGGSQCHPHPIGALERAICEELAVREIIKNHGSGVKIVDVGGNANRHYTAGRDIHSCNPILSPEDILRRHPTAYLSGADYCNEQSQNCSIIPDVYLAVHSLYYLDRDTIMKLLKRCKSNCLYAVVHKFDDIYGGFHYDGAQYESKYQLHYSGDQLRVSMSVTGNMTDYVHDPLLWLEECYFSNDMGAMAWNGWSKGDSWIIKFVLTDFKVDTVKPTVLPLISSIKRGDYCGEVQGILSLNDRSELKPTLEWLEIDNVSIHSVYKFVCISKSGSTKILLPKGAVQCVAAKMVGVERNQRSLKMCIKYMQNLCSPDKLSMPADMLVDSKTYGAALAFIYSLEKEIAAFNSLCSANLHGKYGALARVMDLRSIFNIGTAKTFALMGASLCGTWYTVKKYNCGYSTRRIFDANTILHGFALVGIATATYSWYNSDIVLEEEVVSDYNVNRNSSFGTVDAKKAWQSGLPGYESSMPIREIRDRASVTVQDMEDTACKGEFYAITPTFSNYIPIVPQSSVVNEYISVCNRALMRVATSKPAAWQPVLETALALADSFEQITDVDYEKWNANFEPNRRKEHDLAKMSLEESPLESKDTFRSTFVKRELTMKGGEMMEEFDPRCIQGTSHRANVALGPWMSSFCEQLKNRWNTNEDICYTAGCTAEDLGSWRASFSDEDVLIIENDFTRYDAHQGSESFSCEQLFYNKCGIHNFPEANFVFKSQRRTKGFTPHGVIYEVDYTRKSGDPNTSCGNSIINAVTAWHYLHNVMGLSVRLLVQGDDMIAVVRGTFSSKFKAELKHGLSVYYRNLGFVAKVKLTTAWHEAEFCSSLFWPVEDGFVLGPKIGRRLPKIGFSLKKLTPGEVKGMLLGASIEMSYIPVLRVYIKHCLKEMKTVAKTKYHDKRHKYKCLAVSRHLASDSTFEFFRMRYGVDVSFIEETLSNVLDTAESLTQMVDWPMLDDFVEVDN